MKTFRRCMFVLALAAAFSMPAMAGETQGPSCANPGETQSPPCTDPGATQGPSAASSDQDPGEIHTPGRSSSASGEVDTSTMEIILSLIQSVL